MINYYFIFLHFRVRYVNQPVQRFFDSRGNGGEQLDGSKRNNIYDEVYHSPSDHTYSGGYANIDDVNNINNLCYLNNL